MATCNMYRKFGENWTCGFQDMRADRQIDRHKDRQTYTDRQKDTLIAVLCKQTNKNKQTKIKTLPPSNNLYWR